VYGRSLDGGWVAVQLPTGERGWILAELLNTEANFLNLPIIPPPATPTPTPLPSPQAAYDANVRAGPGTNYDIIAPLYAGTAVEILGRDEDAQWFAIRLPDGTEGWVFASLLSADIDSATLPVISPP
ncbi:MAG: SH3 domain-containing protein, partial [Caldilineae bacterium]